jgi:DNA-binding HxlR family transcriptional regulator
MLGSDYKDQNCSIARALELVGERWTILVLREVFLGRRRFEQMQQALGVARNVLTARLERLVREGVLERVPYQERPLRHEYRLTDKGLDLWPIIVELLRWGDRYAAPPQGPPRAARRTPHLHAVRPAAQRARRARRARSGVRRRGRAASALRARRWRWQ